MNLDDFGEIHIEVSEQHTLKSKIKQSFDENITNSINRSKETLLHVSNITSSCLRKNILEYYFPTSSNYSDQLIKTFQLGIAVHEYIQKILKHNYNFEEEFELKTSVLVGHVDGLIDKKLVVEIKTTNRYKTDFFLLPKSWVKQLLIYMSVLDVEEGILFVVPFGFSDYREFHIKLNSEQRRHLREVVYEKIEFIKSLQPETPEDILKDKRIFHFKTKSCAECKYCPYNSLCYPKPKKR